MKAIITLLFVLFIGIAAQAQNTTAEVKVETIEMEVVQITEINTNETIEATEVARLYRRENARVKKALSFSTKRDRGVA